MQIPYVLRAAGALLLAGFTLITTSHAQTTYVWDGSAGANWSTPANWVDGATPVDAGTAPENIIGFDGNSTANLSMIMDLSSGFDLSKIIVIDPAADLLIRPPSNSSRTIDLWPAAGDPVTIDMSEATVDVSFGSNGTGNLVLNVANGSQTWDVAAGRTLSTVDVDGSTSQILTLTGGGTIVLGGTSDNASLRVNVTGTGTVVNLAKASSGSFHALGGNATSTINAGTTMKVTGTGGDQIYYQHDLQVDGTFDLNGTTEGIDGFNSGSGITSGVVTNTSATAATLRINENGAGGTGWGGVIQDGAGIVNLIKVHTGTQVFTGDNTYTGTTTVSRGVLQLLGANGALSGTTAITLDSVGELRLDSRSASSNGFTAGVNNDRVNDDATIDMHGGILSVYGVGTANVGETVGAITATLGHNVIRLNSDTTGTSSTGLTAASINRTAGTTVAILADNVADFSTATTGDVGYFRVLTGGVNASLLSGAGGTGVNRDILIGFFGNGASGTATGTDFITMESAGGFDYLRSLQASEYATLTSGVMGEENALSTANTTLNLSTGYNALKLTAGSVLIGAGKTLYLGGNTGAGTEGAGMLLFTGGNGFTGIQGSSSIGGLTSLGTIDFGSREAIIRSQGSTVQIDARITGTNGLTKSGSSIVALNNANTFTGAVKVNEGVLQIRNDRGLGAAGGNVYVTGSSVTTLLQLATGVNVTGENVFLGSSGAISNVFVGIGSSAGHNTWGGDVVASNTNLGGRPDQESVIQAGNDASLTIFGNVYGAPGEVPTDPTYVADGNFTRRISFSGSGTGVVNLLGTLSDTASGAAAGTPIDRLRVNMTGNAELNVNVANAVQVSGLFHMLQGYMRYEGTGNFFHSSTGTTDRLVLFDPAGTAGQIAFLLTKEGQSFSRRTAAGATDIQIGNGGSGNATTASNVLIGGENETGVVTYGTGTQHMDFNPVTNGTDVGRFRDLRLYARQGGEVEFKMSMGDEGGFSLNNEIAALTKIGLGTVRLTGRSGTNNDIDGGAYVLGGTLIFDYSTVNNAKIQNADGAQFTTAGGDLRLIKSNSGSIVERMSGSLTVRAGGSEVSIDAATGANVTLRLATNTGAAITRQNGGTLNFVESGAGTKSILVGLAGNQDKRLGSYATYGTANNTATSWAYIDGANDVGAYTHTVGETDTFGATLNTDLTTNATLGGPTTTNSIRINNAAVTSVDLGASTLTVTEGGLLIGSNHNAALSITNGFLTTGNTNDLIIHNYGTGGLTISADITGATQAVTFAGTGITTLAGANSYTGTTYLVGGTVSIGADTALGNAANAIYFNGGELQTTATMTIARGITIGGDAAHIETAGAGNTTTLSGVIAREGNFIYNETNTSINGIVNAANTDNVGVGDIIKTGAGTLLITGLTNTFSGVVDVREGTLQITLADSGTSALNLGTNESWLDGTIIRSGATLAINKLGSTNIANFGEWIRMEDNTTIQVLSGRFGTAGLMEVQGALTINVAGGAQFDQQQNGGYMFGDGDITKTGTGTWMLLGNNSLFTGSLTVLEGTLGARGQGQITGSDFTEVITIGGTGTTAEFRRVSANEFTNNHLVEGHNILVTGTGTKRIGFANGSPPFGDDFIDWNGTITLNSNVELNVDVPANTRAHTAYMRFNGSFLGTANATTRVVNGNATFSRTGVFELNADNTDWTGGLIVGNTSDNANNQHIIRLGNNNALKSDNAVTLRHNSRLQAAGRTVTAGNLTTTGVAGATSNEIVENAAHTDGTLAFTQTTDANWDALFRDGTPIGTIYEQDGSAAVGRLNLVKDGSARATLMLDNQYTGSTTVNAGTLQVGNGGSAAARAVGDTGTGALSSVLTVNSGGRVAGTGTIQGIGSTTTHVVTGIISPGDVTTALSDPTGIGTLDVIGNLNVSGGTIQLQAGGSTFNDAVLAGLETGSSAYNSHITSNAATWDGLANGTTRGNHDLLNIDGQLSLDGDSTVSLTFTGYNPVAGDVLDLLDWLGVLGGSGFDAGTNFRTGGNGGGDLYLPTLGENLVYDVSQFSNSGLVTVVTMVVPEPSRALLFLAGVVSLLFRRRRRGV